MELMAKAKKIAAAVVIAGLGTSALAGCQNVERSTGLGSGAQTGVLTGAAAGGLIAGLAGAHPAWIVGSILLGGLAGGLVGDYLDDRDKQQHSQASYDALQTQQAGGQTSWQNPDTGNSGSTRVLNVYRTSDGRLCKDFQQTINAGGQSETANGTACQEPDGTWKPI